MKLNTDHLYQPRNGYKPNDLVIFDGQPCRIAMLSEGGVHLTQGPDWSAFGPMDISYDEIRHAELVPAGPDHWCIASAPERTLMSHYHVGLFVNNVLEAWGSATYRTEEDAQPELTRKNVAAGTLMGDGVEHRIFDCTVEFAGAPLSCVVPDGEPATCSDCGLPLHADDETCPEVQLQLEEDRIFTETLRPLIDQARKSDDYADLAGEPAQALAALKGALQRAIDTITVIVSHEHEWSDNDYCRVCGADGRA